MDDSPELETLEWRRAGGDENEVIVDTVARLIKDKQKERLVATLRRWHPADVVELFVELPLKRARKLFQWLPQSDASKVIAELSPDFRVALMADATLVRLAELIERLEPEDAVEALEDLPEEVVRQVLPRLSNRDEVEAQLAYGEDSAGSIMSRKFVAVPEDWTIGQVISEVRANAARIEKLYAVFVIDAGRRPIGYLKLRDLLLTPKDALVRDRMRTDIVTVRADIDQEEVVHLAERYELSIVPVVDAEGRLLGRITTDRLQQVIHDEAEEDMALMGGVSPDARADESVARIVRGRLPWLMTGLVGASIAAMVVGSFEAQLARAAILASFIPIVMAMAGNAGIQAATVSVQGLAAGTLRFGDLGWRVGKELLGALLNGTVVALVLGALVMLAAQIVDLDEPLRLALAAGLSLISVTVMAAVIGASVPLVLDRLRIDPALAVGVFITTSNDILGVLVFFLLVTTFYL